VATQSVAIRRKLSSITLITCGIALLLTTLMFLLGQLLLIRQSNLEQLQTLSRAIGANSTAALAFENPEDASSVLSAFRSDPHIEVAALYRADGSMFATYPPSVRADAVPKTPAALGFHFEQGTLVGISTVREGQLTLGTLYVRSDMRTIYGRLGAYALLAATVIVLDLKKAD
jgi:hypothetical protein